MDRYGEIAALLGTEPSKGKARPAGKVDYDRLREEMERLQGGSETPPPSQSPQAEPRCPSCGEPVEPDWVRCPGCTAKLGPG